MDALRRSGIVLAAAVLMTGRAESCGVCIEDKMAATYDHAVVQRAAAEQKMIVFCEAKGPLQAARLQRAAAAVPGIDPGSLRISAEPAAVSFVVDPRVRTPEDAVARLSDGLDPAVTLTLIKALAPAR